MRTTLRVSSRGAVTIPAALRRKLGLNLPNSVVVIEERGGGLFLRAAAASRVRSLPKKQLLRWIKRDETEMAAFLSERAKGPATKDAAVARKLIGREEITTGADASAWAERHAGDTRLRIKRRK